LTKARQFLKLEQVRIITWRALRKFGNKWPAAVNPLREWYAITALARWRSFGDVKATFGQTDQTKVGSGQKVCVFDIGGNKFRLVAFVSYAKGKVYVLRVMTHKEYDKGSQQWKREL
jgi:mRNA interferase HigB